MLDYLLPFLNLSSEGFKKTPHWCFLHQNLSFILQAHKKTLAPLDEQHTDDLRHYHLGFYQFSARDSNYRLVRSLPTSERRWKTKFFFVSRFWAGNLVEVGRDPFPPYIGEMGDLHPEGMILFTARFTSFVIFI